MPNASLLALPNLYDPQRVSAHRATRLGHSGQPLRGAWRPMFRQAGAEAERSVPLQVVKPALDEPQVSAGWWRGLLERIGLLRTGVVAPAGQPPEVQPCAGGPTGYEPFADTVVEVAIDPQADAAASFWQEHLVSPDENMEVYRPAENPARVAAEQPRIGRSFLGAYRKGRRAAEAGLNARHCPYRARLEKEGRAVNALTRTFQRYWAEGWQDGVAGQSERYV